MLRQNGCQLPRLRAGGLQTLERATPNFQLPKWNGLRKGLFAVCVACAILLCAQGANAQEQPPRTTAAQEGFVPIDQLPPEDQLPAAPLLVAAYAIAWVALLGYVWSLWRRLGRVEREMAHLHRRVASTASPPGDRK